MDLDVVKQQITDRNCNYGDANVMVISIWRSVIQEEDGTGIAEPWRLKVQIRKRRRSTVDIKRKSYV